jgi:23S rRNA (cytidine1920-2'-O)/16S rRNA (cytidine1409-2'-O)-methyltransferase
MKERIDNILVKKGYFITRQKAKYAIENKNVYVEGKCIQKVSKLFEEEVKIEIRGETLPFVSRGGLKLEKAIKIFSINLNNKICMDIGASTGGFTDCMLQNGAKLIYAIDVGHNQLDEKIRSNPKVINQEGTNIKQIDTQKQPQVEFITIDVSFISLTQILDKAYKLLKEEGEIVILIKPEFEAGKGHINKKRSCKKYRSSSKNNRKSTFVCK